MAANSATKLLPEEVPTHEFNILPAMVARATTVGFIEELSLAEGLDPFDLPPLDLSVDTESLNNMLVPDTPFFDLDDVTFEYDGRDVTITRDGDVTVSS